MREREQQRKGARERERARQGEVRDIAVPTMHTPYSGTHYATISMDTPRWVPLCNYIQRGTQRGVSKQIMPKQIMPKQIMGVLSTSHTCPSLSLCKAEGGKGGKTADLVPGVVLGKMGT